MYVVLSDGLVAYVYIYINTSKTSGSVPNTKEEEGSYNMGASPPQKFKSSKEKPLLSFATILLLVSDMKKKFNSLFLLPQDNS